MDEPEHLCAQCARCQRTCCQEREIYVTRGDVARIAAFAEQNDFWEFRRPENSEYLDQDDDPLWRDGTIRPDGSRRSLKRREGGDCVFLGSRGCRLPLEVRPLICRLYPFDYDEQGLKPELAAGCPLHLLAPGQSLLQSLQMEPHDALRWHRQLYDEVRQELAAPLEPALTLCVVQLGSTSRTALPSRPGGSEVPSNRMSVEV